MGLDIYFHKTTIPFEGDESNPVDFRSYTDKVDELARTTLERKFRKLVAPLEEAWEKLQTNEYWRRTYNDRYFAFVERIRPLVAKNYDFKIYRYTDAILDFPDLEEKLKEEVEGYYDQYEAYFRKVNFIYRYFEQTLGTMHNECYAFVRPEDVDDLVDRCGKVLENPALKGKVTLMDDIREVIGAGLMSLGYSLNSRKPEEIEAAVKEVLKWKPNIRKFDAESYKTEVPSGATILGHGYSTDVTQVIVGDEEEGNPPRKDIGFALPKEGFTIAFDEMVLSSAAPNPDLAYAFMNFMYEGDNAKANMEYIMGPMPVKPGIDALDADYRKVIILDSETIKRGQVLKPVDDDPAVKELYDKAWDRIKATSEK